MIFWAIDLSLLGFIYLVQLFAIWVCNKKVVPLKKNGYGDQILNHKAEVLFMTHNQFLRIEIL